MLNLMLPSQLHIEFVLILMCLVFFFVLLRAELKFVNNIKYLDIYVCAGKHFKCLIKHMKLNFFRSFNCIIYHSKFAMSEIVSVNLIKMLLFTNC